VSLISTPNQSIVADPSLGASPSSGRPHTVPAFFGEQVTPTSSVWSLYLGLVFFISFTTQLTLFALGPATELTRAVHTQTQRDLELSGHLVQYKSFGLTNELPDPLHARLTEVRAQRGELEPRFTNGVRPEVLRLPGYPAVLAAALGVGLPLQVVLLIQCLLGASLSLLIYGIGKALLHQSGPALAAALIVALHPATIVFPSALLSNTIFAALLLAGLWLVTAHENRDVACSALAGLALGLAALFQPAVVFLGPLVASWMLFSQRQLKTIVLAVVLCLTALCPPAVWAARNNAVGFGPRVSSQPYIDGWFGTVAHMRQIAQPKTATAAPTAMLDELRQQHNTDEDLFRLMRRLTLKNIADQPQLAARALGQSAWQFFTAHSVASLCSELGLTYRPDAGFHWGVLPSAADGPSAWIGFLWTALNLLLLVGMIIGAILLLVRRRLSVLVLLGGITLYVLLASHAHPSEQARLPVLGLQALLVASIFASNLRRPRPRKARATDNTATDDADSSWADAPSRPI
jgi:hypothetical protein